MNQVEEKARSHTKLDYILLGIIIGLLGFSCLWLWIRVDSLQTRNFNLVEKNNYLLSEVERAIFYFYYIPPTEQSFGVYDLDSEIKSRDWVAPYVRGEFDCSEMSACLEWQLENLGWHTVIVTGNSPEGSGYHAWLLVETEEGEYTPVGATSLQVVWEDNPYYDNYLVYDFEFETIQDALAYLETEFDWWS